MRQRIAYIVSAAFMVAFILGCPKQETRQQRGEMDTPGHHVRTAHRLIMQNDDWEGAYSEYQLALGLDPDYSPALIGQAVYYAHKSDEEKAEQLRRKAWSNVGEDNDKKLDYYANVIKYHSILKGNDWLEKCEKALEKGKKINPRHELLYLYMGDAYMAAYRWRSAENMYKKVIELNGSYREVADARWKKAQKIVRAGPGTIVGKKIALVEKITKADVAALFVEEMHLPELWRKRGIKTWETPEFRPPGQSSGGDAPTMPTDIADHPLKTDIREVLKLGIRGLEADPGGKFHPDKPITRAEYAVMLEDVLIKVLNEPGLASKYVGERESKFHDMRTDHWAYNAAVVMTSRGLIPQNMEGKFYPTEPVSGADALLVIRKMMDYLRIG